MKKFNLVVCGGTFDHFHKGHESLLKLAFSLGNKVIIGITSDDYINSSKFKVPASQRGEQSSKLIETFEKRKQSVLGLIKKEEVSDKTEIVKIDDLFGPTLSKDYLIDAIVVSEDTRKGAEIINERRKRIGLKELNLFIAPQVLAEDGKLISSARIRNGEIDRTGRLYIKPSWFKTGLILPQNLRQELKKPFGELLKDIKSLFNDKNCLLITVGDVTTKAFNEKSLEQNISVIDLRVNREKKFTNIKELGFVGSENIYYADNPAGYISSNLFEKLSEIFQSKIKDKIILQVNGEEDLVVLPLILVAPLNAVIYYGQPNQGIVRIRVSEEIKKIVYELVNRFEIQKWLSSDDSRRHWEGLLLEVIDKILDFLYIFRTIPQFHRRGIYCDLGVDNG